MSGKVFILLLSTFLVCPIFASQTKVAFLEIRKWNGDKLILEPGFPYAHLAIQFKNQWLHAHPKRGVELVNTEKLSELGRINEILITESVGVNPHLVEKLLGREYDSNFSWTDDQIYCSELVAKLIGMPASPMHFDPVLWPTFYHQYEGMPGMSPSKIYDFLKHELLAEPEEFYFPATSFSSVGNF